MTVETSSKEKQIKMMYCHLVQLTLGISKCSVRVSKYLFISWIMEKQSVTVNTKSDWNKSHLHPLFVGLFGLLQYLLLLL